MTAGRPWEAGPPHLFSAVNRIFFKRLSINSFAQPAELVYSPVCSGRGDIVLGRPFQNAAVYDVVATSRT